MYQVLVAGYVISIVLTMLMRVCKRNDDYLIWKSVSSILFLVLAFLLFVGSKSIMFAWMFPGLLLCFAGDVFMGLAYDEHNQLNRHWFVPGVYSFLIAHIIFTVAVWQVYHGNLWLIGGVGVFICLLTYGTIKSKAYDYQEYGKLCLAYSLFLGLFCGSGVSILASNTMDHKLLCLGVGAVLFMLSDLALSTKLFKKKPPVTVAAFILPLYYGGIYLMIQIIG